MISVCMFAGRKPCAVSLNSGSDRGLEEQFLASRGAHDQIIYSLLRARDPALVRELWIRIEEGETTFAEAAQIYGEGPEAERKGSDRANAHRSAGSSTVGRAVAQSPARLPFCSPSDGGVARAAPS